MIKPPLSRVLELLRLIRDSNSAEPIGHILSRALKVSRNSPAFFREIAVLLELTDAAVQAVNEEDRLDAEGRSGLLHTLTQLKSAIQTCGMDQPVQKYFPNVNLEITQFSLIAGFVQKDSPLCAEADHALVSLDAELTDLYKKVQAAEISVDAKRAARQYYSPTNID
ncbi:MAG: hypothetical protein NVV62_02410 [Terricaulis sp.]|nr:hypothetical protein [Terricaulis sp.]